MRSLLPSPLINGELGFLISNTPLGLAALADNGDVEGCRRRRL